MSEKEYQYSSGNIFQDLELENADELLVQSRLAFKLELQQTLDSLNEIFKKRFHGAEDEIRLETISTFTNTVSGFIISPEFENKTEEQRIDMIWDLLKNNESERKHINIIFPLTHQEKNDLES